MVKFLYTLRNGITVDDIKEVDENILPIIYITDLAAYSEVANKLIPENEIFVIHTKMNGRIEFDVKDCPSYNEQEFNIAYQQYIKNQNP